MIRCRARLRTAGPRRYRLSRPMDPAGGGLGEDEIVHLRGEGVFQGPGQLAAGPETKTADKKPLIVVEPGRDLGHGQSLAIVGGEPRREAVEIVAPIIDVTRLLKTRRP